MVVDKRKAGKQAAGAPAAKEAKTEEPKAEEPEKEEPKEEPEEPKEKEVDDKKDLRPQIKERIVFHSAETTLNAVPTASGKCLMALTDGGMQFLIAGARSSAGVKTGRYFYEVKVVEALTPWEGRSQGRRVPMPRQLVRLGFSLEGSSLILGDGESCACFDSEGFFFADKKRTQAATRFGREQVLGVLLNRDSKSPNFNTMSLFCNGQRVSEPQALPEKLKSQPLFPHVSFRNVSLQVNFGPTPITALPFKCRMLQEAAKADVQEVKEQLPKDGKYEVVFPVAFPDEGTFDWLDSFMEKNPSHVELSDRKIIDWAVKSGIWKPRSNNSWTHSNDKPDFNFGIQFMEDFSTRRCINAIAAVVPRNYVVMEVQKNLTQAERKANMRHFGASHFKRVAHVVMGEPKKAYKDRVQKKLLEDKQAKAELEWKMRKLEKERKKAVAQRQKEIAEQKAALEAKQKEEAAAKEAAAKEKEEEAKPAEDGGKQEEAAKPAADSEEAKDKAEVKEEKEEKEEEPKAKEEEEEADEPMPQVELTEDEQKMNFKPVTSHDIASQVLDRTFDQFCIPEEGEGFDAIRFEWADAAGSKAYLKKWVLEKKLTTRIEDVQPSEWFKGKASEFQKACQEWQTKQKAFKETKKDAAAPAKKDPVEGEETKEDEDDDEGSKKEEVDIFSVEDVCDIGNGEPLFGGFEFEDWALLTLRFELHLLQAAFRKDVNDPERLGIHENHLLFYYSRYFRKQLNPRSYGKDTPVELIELVKDTVKIDSDKKFLISVLSEEPEAVTYFVRLQEENRRKRQQRIDAGDETARLSFGPGPQQQGGQQPWEGAGNGGGGGNWPRKGGGSDGGGWTSLRPSRVPAAGKGDAAPGPVGGSPGAAGPRVVPAPRGQTWQSPQSKPSWQSGKAAGGRWQQTYAPKLGGKGSKTS